MGSTFTDHAIGPCHPSEVKKAFWNLVEDHRREYGSGGYSGSFAEKNSVIVDKSIFATRNDAYDYLSKTYDDKWGAAGAVRFVHDGNAPIPSRVTQLQTSARKLQQDLNKVPIDALARVKSGKSKTKGCPKCGSSLAVSYLRSVSCPVCLDPDIVLAKSDLEKMDRLKAKISELQSSAAAEHKTWAAEVVQRASARPDGLKWLIGGQCSC